MQLNKPSCRFSICNHLFQFLRGHSKSRPPGEFPYEPFKTLNHSHISYHGSPASVFSVWWCNPFARSAGKFDHADLSFVNATTHQSTSSGERVVRRYPLKRETSPREIMNVNAGSDALTSELKIS